MLRRHIITIALLAALLVPSAANAHDPQARHGGRMGHAGGYHVELVVRGTTVEAFLLGHDDRAVPVEGYKGTALLVVDGKRQRIELAPRSDRLAGDAETALPEKVKGIVRITSPAGVTANARFD